MPVINHGFFAIDYNGINRNATRELAPEFSVLFPHNLTVFLFHQPFKCDKESGFEDDNVVFGKINVQPSPRYR
jgi:hypothetical protein